MGSTVTGQGFKNTGPVVGNSLVVNASCDVAVDAHDCQLALVLEFCTHPDPWYVSNGLQWCPQLNFTLREGNHIWLSLAQSPHIPIEPCLN